MSNNKSLYLLATVSLVSAFGLVIAIAKSPLIGFLISAVGIGSGIVIGSLIKPRGKGEREFGFGSLNDDETKEAVKWGALSLSAFVLFVFDELFFIAGVIMIIYAGLAFVLKVSWSRRKEIALQRLGIALLFFIAQMASFLLVVPITVLIMRYAWIFIPDDNKMYVGGRNG